MLAALGCAPAVAADRPVELSVFVGARTGADLDAGTTGGSSADAGVGPSLGLSVGWWVRPDAWLEVLFDRQRLEFDSGTTGRFDLDVDFLQFGASYEPPRNGPSPYVTVALGLSRYGADPGSVSDGTGFSASVAGGLKVPIGTRALFRLEARGWAAFTSASAAVSCGPGCSFDFSGSGWWQLGLRAGFAFRTHGRTPPGRVSPDGGTRECARCIASSSPR